MYTILLSYDLRIPESSSDYLRLIEYIKSHGTWAKPLKSLWLFKTNKRPSVVRNEVMRIVDSNDGVLVIDVTGDDWATYGIPKKVTDWMDKNM
jgi:predicted RNA-binding protein